MIGQIISMKTQTSNGLIHAKIIIEGTITIEECNDINETFVTAFKQDEREYRIKRYTKYTLIERVEKK